MKTPLLFQPLHHRHKPKAPPAASTSTPRAVSVFFPRRLAAHEAAMASTSESDESDDSQGGCEGAALAMQRLLVQSDQSAESLPSPPLTALERTMRLARFNPLLFQAEVRRLNAERRNVDDLAAATSQCEPTALTSENEASSSKPIGLLSLRLFERRASAPNFASFTATSSVEPIQRVWAADRSAAFSSRLLTVPSDRSDDDRDDDRDEKSTAKTPIAGYRDDASTSATLILTTAKVSFGCLRLFAPSFFYGNDGDRRHRLERSRLVFHMFRAARRPPLEDVWQLFCSHSSAGSHASNTSRSRLSLAHVGRVIAC